MTSNAAVLVVFMQVFICMNVLLHNNNYNDACSHHRNITAGHGGVDS